jgi:hypothetical protein
MVAFKLNVDSTAPCKAVDKVFKQVVVVIGPGSYRFCPNLCVAFHTSHWVNIKSKSPVLNSCDKGLVFIDPKEVLGTKTKQFISFCMDIAQKKFLD